MSGRSGRRLPGRRLTTARRNDSGLTPNGFSVGSSLQIPGTAGERRYARTCWNCPRQESLEATADRRRPKFQDGLSDDGISGRVEMRVIVKGDFADRMGRNVGGEIDQRNVVRG